MPNGDPPYCTLHRAYNCACWTYRPTTTGVLPLMVPETAMETLMVSPLALHAEAVQAELDYWYAKPTEQRPQEALATLLLTKAVLMVAERLEHPKQIVTADAARQASGSSEAGEPRV